MSPPRSMLKPVSRLKEKQKVQQKNESQKGQNDETVMSPSKPKSPKVQSRPKAYGGFFSAWFDVPPGYDEEEDSKTWEQPWPQAPTFPAAPLFAPLTPSPTPPPSEKDKVEKPQTKSKVVVIRGRAAKNTRVKARHSSGDDIFNHTRVPLVSRSVNIISGSNQHTVLSPLACQAAAVGPVRKAAAGGLRTRNEKATFLALPLEVRDEIYGRLLTSATPITVLHSWTQCYGRFRGGLQPAILSVCRQTYQEAQRILYSSNTFLYLIRDGGDPLPEALRPEGCGSLEPRVGKLILDPPSAAELAKSRGGGGTLTTRRTRAQPKPVMTWTYKKSTVGDAHRVIYLAKYAHLIRRVEIALESNRECDEYRVAMVNAIQLLGNGDGGVNAKLASLRFSLSPLERPVSRPGWGSETEWTVARFFSSARSSIARIDDVYDFHSKETPQVQEDGTTPDVIKALRKLDVRLLHFTVYTPSSRRLDMTLDMNYRRTSREPWECLMSNDPLIEQERQEVALASSEAFRNLQRLIVQACAETDKAVEDGWWMEYGPPQVAAVRSAMEGLDTMKAKMKRFHSPWYQRIRSDLAENPVPEYSSCVRRASRMSVLQPQFE